VLAIDVGAVSEGSAAQWLSSTLLGAINEHVRRVARERSGDAQRRTVERGALPYPGCPRGLRKREDGRLEPHPVEAPIVAEMIELRAAGKTITECRKHLQANGIDLSWRSVRTLIQTPLMVGELRFGQLVNATACEPIVDRETWQRAQTTEIRGPQAKSPRLLARLGVLRCVHCGHAMSIGQQTTKRGQKYAFYRCAGVLDCPSKQSISATAVEAVVVDAVKQALADIEGRASAESNAREAERELVRAQEALDTAIRSFADLIGEPAAQETLEKLREARDGARDRLDRVGGGATLTVSMGDWDELSLDARRALIRATVAQATVGPGRGADRVTVQLHG
jgi:hypothetical protein